MYATEESSQWTEGRPSNRHESASEVRERVIQEGFQIIDRSAIILGRKIGEGGQGIIYEASWRPEFSLKRWSVVVKKFKPLKGISQGQCPPRLWALSFVNVCVPDTAYFDRDDSLCTVMPRFSSDLRTLIDSQLGRRANEDGAPFSEQVAVSIITKLALGLKALHDLGIYHRDIKAANILVNSDPNSPTPEVYLADFENSDNVVGTGFWRAPEILQTLHVPSEDRIPLSGKQLQAADVYSFGMTCYEILTGRYPFDDQRWSDYSLVLSGGRPELPEHVPGPLANIIRRIWHENPDARPSFTEIIALLKEVDSSAGVIVWLQEARASECEASMKLWHAPPEACLVEMNRILLKLEEFHTAGLDIPAVATVVLLVGEFIATSEQFVSKFGWDSHLRHPSLPFVESLERRRLVTLLHHQMKQFGANLYAVDKEFLVHQDRIAKSGIDPLHLSRIMQLAIPMRRLWTCIWEGEAQSSLSKDDESPELTWVDKLSILQAFIDSLLDAGMTKIATFSAVVDIDDQLCMLDGARYGEVRNKFCLKWVFMIVFHPFYDSLTTCLDTLFSFKTILLCVVLGGALCVGLKKLAESKSPNIWS